MKSARFLGEEKISALLWRFSLPAIAGMLITALYNVVDSIFVGQGVGEIALTAVTIAFPVMTLLMAFGMLIGVGAATMVSIRLGEKRQDEAEHILGNALSMMIVLILVSTGLAVYFLDTILVDFMGVTPEVLPYAHDFTFIILLGSVFQHVGFGLNNVIRAQGDPRTAMATQVLAALVNVVLNYAFVFVLPWGVRGAALATVIAQAVAAVWVIYYFTLGPGLLKFRWCYLPLKAPIVRSIFKIGVAPFLMQLGASAVMVVLNVRIQMYGGTTAVAAYGIVNRIMLLLLMPVIGISQGAQPIIGYNFGARQFDRVIRTLTLATVAAVTVSFLGYLWIELFPETVILLFNDSPNLLVVGVPGIRIYLALVPIVAYQIIATNYFQATGKPLYCIFFSLLRQILVLIPLVYILSTYYGLYGIWFAGPVSDLASAVVTGVVLYFDVMHLKKQAKKEALYKVES